MLQDRKQNSKSLESQIFNSTVNNIIDEIQAGNNPSITEILQTTMNLLMLAERNRHVNNNPKDKGNGYFSRELGTAMGKINLNIPRDRDGDFRPSILPEPYMRDYQERYNILHSLFLNGYSPNNIRRTLNSLGLHYNPDELKELAKEYYELFKQWQNRQLPEDVLGLFIDAYHCETNIDGKVCKTVLYVVIGIDFNAQKELFGLYVYEGSENKGFWLQTLNQLLKRGVKRPLFIISDDFPGLKNAVATLFPETLHQLCFIHMQRNVRRNMGTNDAKEFNDGLKQIKSFNKYEDCKKHFSDLCEKYREKYPDFMRTLLEDTNNYFAFKHMPIDVQKYFYTTNIVESVNSTIEKIRIRMGGFFQSKDALFLNVFIAINSLTQRKWKHGIPIIKANLYYLRQLFAQQFGELPREQT